MSVLSFLTSIFSKSKTSVIQTPPKALINQKSYDLILKYEASSEAYYNKFLKKLTYPGGASGITGGIGFDFGYSTKEKIKAAWSFVFTEQQLQQLYKTVGVTGTKAKALLSNYLGYIIEFKDAKTVFEKITIPEYFTKARNTFPCFDELHPDAQGVLVSLVFNRGTSTVGDSRREMKYLTQLTCSKNYKEMARQIRLMKRLWVGKGLDGLLTRREEEAKIMESCA